MVDRRWIEVRAGESTVRLDGVANTLEPDSLALRAVDGEVVVRERSFDPGLGARDGIGGQVLNDAIGRDVEIDRGGRRLRGRLAAVRGLELVLDDGRSVVTVPIDGVRSLAIAGVTRPARAALRATLSSARAGRHLFEMVYVADGLAFRVIYVVHARVGAGTQATAEVRALAHIEDRSGLDLRGTDVSLVAGQLGEAEDKPLRFWTGRLELGTGGVRQVEVLSGRPVPAVLESVYRGAMADAVNPPGEPAFGTQMQPRVMRHLVVRLERGGSLGHVLPPGTAVVELEDGEAPADAAPGRFPTALAERVVEGDSARFELDVLPDLFGNRRQSQVDRAPDGRHLTESYEVTIANSSSRPARVHVIEPLARSGDATVDESEPRAERRGKELHWEIEVPASGESRVTYRVTYRF